METMKFAAYTMVALGAVMFAIGIQIYKGVRPW